MGGGRQGSENGKTEIVAGQGGREEGKKGERSVCAMIEKERRGRDRGRERDRQRARQTESETDRDRERDRQRQKAKQTDRSGWGGGGGLYLLGTYGTTKTR